MTPADDRDIAELEEALGRLASNPRIPTVARRRLTQLHSSVRSRRLSKANAVLSDRDIDRFEVMMARLQIGIRAKKQALELQLKQYAQREERLTQLLEAIDERRRQREKETGDRRRASSAKSKDTAGGSL